MIRASNLERRFGEKVALAGLDLAVPECGFLLVTGPNGSGKSTLLGLLAGLLAPTRGELDVGAERHEIGLLAHEPLVYRELRRTVGDRAFFEALERYVSLYAFRSAPRGGFFAQLAKGPKKARVNALARRWLEQAHGDEDLGQLKMPGLGDGAGGFDLGSLLGGRGQQGDLSGAMKMLEQLLKSH